MHALLPTVTDVWWATLTEPGEIHATARWPDVLRRVDPALHQDLLHEVTQEARRVAGGWEQGHPLRMCPPPPMPPAAGGRRLTLRRPLHRPARPPWAGDRPRPLDHGAAGPGAEMNLQACFAAPLAPYFAPTDHSWLSTCVGGYSPPPPPPLGPPGLRSPPRPGGVPPCTLRERGLSGRLNGA